MAFNSGEFLVFFPVVTLIYFIIPHKFRYMWLLIASYYFYMGWNAIYALLILTSTTLTYLSGIILQKIKSSSYDESRKIFFKKLCVIFSLISNLGILFYFKYTQFFFNTLNEIFSIINFETIDYRFNILLPAGISFYTFQALSYTIDVYRDEIYAEKNFFKYALFVSFFPQLVAGPIERSKNLLVQINEKHKFDFISARNGFIIMLWGYFLKIVLADRMAIFVNTVYGDYVTYQGSYLIIATILFAFQIYCDFNGYTMIARGAAMIMGFRLMENFDAPYLSSSVSEFWRRWHISLTSWFKDYLYIPLGGSRRGTLRKYINKMIVFLISGLWHGASLSYVFWGGINGLYQVGEEILAPIHRKLEGRLNLNPSALSNKLVKGVITFILIDFSWIFFRAKGLKESFLIIKSMFTTKNIWILFDGSLYSCGLDQKNFSFMLICIAILILIDICRRKDIRLIKVFSEQDFWFRCLFISLFTTFILIFGLYGSSYDASNFIYFQF